MEGEVPQWVWFSRKPTILCLHHFQDRAMYKACCSHCTMAFWLHSIYILLICSIVFQKLEQLYVFHAVFVALQISQKVLLLHMQYCLCFKTILTGIFEEPKIFLNQLEWRVVRPPRRKTWAVKEYGKQGQDPVVNILTGFVLTPPSRSTPDKIYHIYLNLRHFSPQSAWGTKLLTLCSHIKKPH